MPFSEDFCERADYLYDQRADRLAAAEVLRAGHGKAAWWMGTQVIIQQVHGRKVQVLCGDGALRWCSPKDISL